MDTEQEDVATVIATAMYDSCDCDSLEIRGAFGDGTAVVIDGQVNFMKMARDALMALAKYNMPSPQPQHPFPQGASVRAIRNIVRGTVPGGSVVVSKGALGIINAVMSVGIGDTQGYDVSFDFGPRVFVSRDEVELSYTRGDRRI